MEDALQELVRQALHDLLTLDRLQLLPQQQQLMCLSSSSSTGIVYRTLFLRYTLAVARIRR